MEASGRTAVPASHSPSGAESMKPIPPAGPRAGGLALLPARAAPGGAEESARLQEQFPAGYQYHVSTRVQLSGTLTLPPEKDKPAPKPLPITGESAIDYDERVVAA